MLAILYKISVPTKKVTKSFENKIKSQQNTIILLQQEIQALKKMKKKS